MCDVFFCISDAPVDPEQDPRFGNTNTWKLGMKDAPFKEPLYFAYGFCCPCCASYSARTWVLNNDMSQYSCCQAKYQVCGFPSPTFHQGYPPELCLCLEACCCTGISMSATRQYVMDNKVLMSDPCDNRIIRCNNYLQCLNIIVKCAAAMTDNQALDDAAWIIDLIADCVFMTVMGCMAAQVHYEVNEQNPNINPQKQPGVQEMKR